MSRRRKARETALQALYAAELSDAGWEKALGDAVSRRKAGPETVEYAGRLVKGVSATRRELDGRIAARLENWKIERISAVDRIILEIALFELLECPEVPEKVIIDEAIEIAHRFSSEKAGSFVNGLLDRLAREVRTD